MFFVSNFNFIENIDDFECNSKGYDKFLSQWSYEDKCTSRDPLSFEYKQRLEYFIDSCKKIHEHNKLHEYPLEFTFYADWHSSEFEMITTTTQRFSNDRTSIPDMQFSVNNTNYRYLLPSTNPCDDINGGSALKSRLCKPQKSSVSWAFAITNSIEYAVKKMYLEQYGQLVSISLSAQELIDCVGKQHGITNNNHALLLSWGFDYVYEHGIAYRQYYPFTSLNSECHDVDVHYKYHIAGYEKPYVYNKYGLFELLQKGPVAVALGLDPEYFQFYQNDRENNLYFDTTFWRPSVYGVVVEFNQYVEDGSNEYSEWPFFTIESRLRACDSIFYKLPIRDSTDNSNIANIAEFAIRPVVSDPILTSFICNEQIYPTIESIPTYATELIFEENSYSSIQVLSLARFTQLQSIIVKDGAFKNCYSVTADNSALTTMIIGDHCFKGVSPYGMKRHLTNSPSSFTIVNAIVLSTIHIGSDSLSQIDQIKISNVNNPCDINIGKSSLANIKSIKVNESRDSSSIYENLSSLIKSANPRKNHSEQIMNHNARIPTQRPTSFVPISQPSNDDPLFPPYEDTVLPPASLPEIPIPIKDDLPPLPENPVIQPISQPVFKPAFKPEFIPATQPATQPVSQNLTQSATPIPFTFDCTGDILEITNDNDCYKIQYPCWSSIIVYANLCNNITSDISISNSNNLESIVVKEWSFRNVSSLTVSNNPSLKTFVVNIGDIELTDENHNIATFGSVKDLVFSSNLLSNTLIIKTSQV